MNVGELKAILEPYPDDMPCIVSHDEEGNGFNLLNDVEQASVADIDGDCDVLHPDDVDDHDEEDLTLAVVFWP